MAKYLPAALPALIERQESQGIVLGSEMEMQLLQMSPATAERLLRVHRPHHLRQPHISSRVASDVSHRIAVHTFAELRALPVGHLEIDLVLHCGMTTGDFFLTTLVAVEVISSWTFCIPVWGKGKERVSGAVAQVQRQAPFCILGIHSDNGSEFLNDTLYQYCQCHKLEFTHSRPYHKNDQPRVEQRNGSLVRRLIGYGRYASRAAFAQMGEVYNLACTHANFFRPTAKLLSTERHGSRVTRHYDQPQTPYQRLLASDLLTSEQRQRLQDQYCHLDPLVMQRQLSSAIDHLWSLEAVDPVSQRAQRLRQAVRDAVPR